jgi:hypothetical protein
MLVARPHGDPARFEAIAANLLSGLTRLPGDDIPAES